MNNIIPNNFIAKGLTKLFGPDQQKPAETGKPQQKPAATTVKKGDSLSKMMLKQGYSLQELTARDSKGKTLLDKVASQNNLKNANHIEVGQKLNLPPKAGKPDAGKPTSQAGKPSSSDGVSLSKEAQNCSGAGEGCQSTVKKGDSLSKMMLSQGYKMEDLLAKNSEGKTLLEQVASQNGLKNPNVIRPGQELTFPTFGETKPDSTKPGTTKPKVDLGGALADAYEGLGEGAGRVAGMVLPFVSGDQGASLGGKAANFVTDTISDIFRPGK